MVWMFRRGMGMFTGGGAKGRRPGSGAGGLFGFSESTARLINKDDITVRFKYGKEKMVLKRRKN